MTEGGIVTTERARELRWNMTDAERRLWALLRRKKLAGYRFRRQASIGPYYADFFCPKARLIIEVDGTFHGDEDQNERDLERTLWLEAHGCRVIRFWNKHVLMYPDRIADAIYGELAAPLPSGIAALPRSSPATFPHKGGR
jgi:very-short-patch-repair endonuclease